jgi:hypothetical protein
MAAGPSRYTRCRATLSIALSSGAMETLVCSSHLSVRVLRSILSFKFARDKRDAKSVSLSTFAILTSPLILGNDPRNMSKACLDIVANKEIIALNQVGTLH